MKIDYTPLNNFHPDSILRKFSSDAHIAIERNPKQVCRMRLPLLLLAGDGNVAVSTLPPAATRAGEKAIPLKVSPPRDENARFLKIIETHVRHEMLHRDGPSAFAVRALGFYRFFRDERHGNPTTILTMPSVVEFGALPDEVPFKYRYQERYGALEWMNTGVALEAFSTQSEQANPTKATFEAIVLLNLLQQELEARHAAHP